MGAMFEAQGLDGEARDDSTGRRGAASPSSSYSAAQVARPPYTVRRHERKTTWVGFVPRHAESMRLRISISGATCEENASEGQGVGRDTDEVAVCCPRTQPDPLSQASGKRSARTRIEALSSAAGLAPAFQGCEPRSCYVGRRRCNSRRPRSEPAGEPKLRTERTRDTSPCYSRGSSNKDHPQSSSVGSRRSHHHPVSQTRATASSRFGS